ncbi:MAG TPA: hypothetical protein VMM37_08410, partial [Bacteroidota bacterium]|nr:hypothetical protein [Bacteroidota bacterium]
MWVDVHDDGSCHVGIDALMAAFITEVERLQFVVAGSVPQPAAVLTVRGIDLPLTFPEKIRVKGVNAYLRARPDRLTSHPYTLGWLFEGILGDSPEGGVRRLEGQRAIGHGEASQWMKRESRRLDEFIRDKIIPTNATDLVTMTDGGTWNEGLITHLTRE